MILKWQVNGYIDKGLRHRWLLIIDKWYSDDRWQIGWWSVNHYIGLIYEISLESHCCKHFNFSSHSLYKEQ